MNYLAHLFLSCHDEDLLIGNFIADSIKNKEVAAFPYAIQQGIHLHRMIDSYTDNHPLVKEATKRLHSKHRKYSPVVIDIYFDNLLSNNWQLYSKEPLREFATRMYQILIKHQSDLPVKMQAYVPNMIAHDWLQQYGKLEGLQYTFERMARRAKFNSNFVNAVQHLKEDSDYFNEIFNRFFPDVIQMVNDFCGCG